jgi:soluble lytic murein transglycosylase-like protein
MQIMPGTAPGLGVTNAFDPAQAVDGAAKLLSANLKEFGSLDLAVAAYNAGGGAVKKYGGIPPYAETQAYVPKVKAALAALGG